MVTELLFYLLSFVAILCAIMMIFSKIQYIASYILLQLFAIVGHYFSECTIFRHGSHHCLCLAQSWSYFYM